jgi:hypothetical protein
MSTLIYSAITSLDGYIADTEGNFDVRFVSSKPLVRTARGG